MRLGPPADPPPWLKAIDRPIVLVTTSSEFQNDTRLVQVALQALARGVPVCAVPFGRDQLEVARRVEVAGAGTRLPAKRLRPDRLRAKVHEAIGLSEGARRIQQAFAAAGGPPAAADAVETRLLHSELPQKLPS